MPKAPAACLTLVLLIAATLLWRYYSLAVEQPRGNATSRPVILSRIKFPELGVPAGGHRGWPWG